MNSYLTLQNVRFNPKCQIAFKTGIQIHEVLGRNTVIMESGRTLDVTPFVLPAAGEIDFYLILAYNGDDVHNL